MYSIRLVLVLSVFCASFKIYMVDEPGAILIVAFISTIRNDLTRRHEEGCHKHGKSLAPASWNTVEYMVAIV